MSYFIVENEELKLVNTEKLPADLEELYQKIRKLYVIQYIRSDWASDTSDNGMGYDYDNSYEIFREPERREMVIKDGKLVGLYVGFSDDIRLEHEATEKYLLKLEKDAKICQGKNSVCYGDSKTWMLHINEEALPLESVCLFWVKAEDRDHIFEVEEFDCKYIESVSDKCSWEDSDGYFNGAFRVTLKLTKEGIENPDSVLQALQMYRPILVKE